MLKYRGYTGYVEFDDEAGLLHGEVLDTRDVITFQGRSVEEMRQAFRESIDDYLHFCAERGEEPDKPFSGKFVARLPSERHHRAYIKAMEQGKSLNQFVTESLEKVILDRTLSYSRCSISHKPICEAEDSWRTTQPPLPGQPVMSPEGPRLCENTLSTVAQGNQSNKYLTRKRGGVRGTFGRQSPWQEKVVDPAGACRRRSAPSAGSSPIAVRGRGAAGDAELKRQAEGLRRLADQLESLAEERRSTRRAVREILAPRERDLLARAAARLPAREAEALLDLPQRLKSATRRVRLSAEILAHHLGTMSTLLRKATLEQPSSHKTAV